MLVYSDLVTFIILLKNLWLVSENYCQDNMTRFDVTVKM